MNHVVCSDPVATELNLTTCPQYMPTELEHSHSPSKRLDIDLI